MQSYKDNKNVLFADVNLSEEQIRESAAGDPYSPGAGGWPTIRTFNNASGIAGRKYGLSGSGCFSEQCTHGRRWGM